MPNAEKLIVAIITFIMVGSLLAVAAYFVAKKIHWTDTFTVVNVSGADLSFKTLDEYKKNEYRVIDEQDIQPGKSAVYRRERGKRSPIIEIRTDDGLTTRLPLHPISTVPHQEHEYHIRRDNGRLRIDHVKGNMG